MNDPGQFLEQYQNKVILDEVQAVPESVPYLQNLTDKRQRKGYYYYIAISYLFRYRL
jgi:predicted AAA+ superfamily ATPase